MPPFPRSQRYMLRFLGALAVEKVLEFVIGAALTTALFFFDPVPPLVFRENLSISEAAHDALLTWGLFYGVTLYPVVASICILLARAGRWRKSQLAALGSLFALVYTVIWIALFKISLPVSFWFVWLLMGCVIFSLYSLAFRFVPDSREVGSTDAS